MSRKRCLLVFSAVVFLVTAGLAFGGGKPESSSGVTAKSSSQASPYKIGVTLALSGSMAWAGVEPRDALTMEVKRINANGGVDGHPLQLIIQDNAGDPSKTAATYTKLVQDDKVTAVIGPIFGALVPTVSSLAQRDQVPTIVLCPSDKSSRSNKWLYFIPHNGRQVAPMIVDYLVKHNIKSAMTWSDDEPLWMELASLVDEQGKAKGISMYSFPETYNADAIDLTPQLIKIRSIVEKNHIQVLIACTHGGIGAVIAKNMAAIGMTLPIIGTNGFGIPMTLTSGGKYVNGIDFPNEKIIVANDLAPDTPANRIVIDFAKRFRETYKREATVWSANGYDAIHLLADALKRSGNDRSKLRDALENTKGFLGTNGVFNYSPTDHDGLSTDGLVWVKIENDQFRLMKQ